ncbi:uncharacterized protein MONOS_547 [Monocercomonoides exilis]|uniref:uncharacterized protein n=1 Tax=Monocercomonoides exilis TaxID=2049356 RepID=UPI0035595470|nr:hypothetical protein MONOS_547 [Monocercomonoides exilis]|eukprot:MONOS_547.1-p1 / transcript=MONOS_547.1 / gene=MONOS_547 / organism=Monocercomonoides_exilis_PA203 / gene_product=unspecified product / transcript_product=unspecified product / location=Mono_scaffold00008:277718-280061(-) / protein_length=709 / sequence_SO=supercontig / SO=protein_coding / is_pseudo=false
MIVATPTTIHYLIKLLTSPSLEIVELVLSILGNIVADQNDLIKCVISEGIVVEISPIIIRIIYIFPSECLSSEMTSPSQQTCISPPATPNRLQSLPKTSSIFQFEVSSSIPYSPSITLISNLTWLLSQLLKAPVSKAFGRLVILLLKVLLYSTIQQMRELKSRKAKAESKSGIEKGEMSSKEEESMMDEEQLQEEMAYDERLSHAEVIQSDSLWILSHIFRDDFFVSVAFCDDDVEWLVKHKLKENDDCFAEDNSLLNCHSGEEKTPAIELPFAKQISECCNNTMGDFIVKCLCNKEAGLFLPALHACQSVCSTYASHSPSCSIGVDSLVCSHFVPVLASRLKSLVVVSHISLWESQHQIKSTKFFHSFMYVSKVWRFGCEILQIFCDLTKRIKPDATVLLEIPEVVVDNDGDYHWRQMRANTSESLDDEEQSFHPSTSSSFTTPASSTISIVALLIGILTSDAKDDEITTKSLKLLYCLFQCSSPDQRRTMWHDVLWSTEVVPTWAEYAVEVEWKGKHGIDLSLLTKALSAKEEKGSQGRQWASLIDAISHLLSSQSGAIEQVLNLLDLMLQCDRRDRKGQALSDLSASLLPSLSDELTQRGVHQTLTWLTTSPQQCVRAEAQRILAVFFPSMDSPSEEALESDADQSWPISEANTSHTFQSLPSPGCLPSVRDRALAKAAERQQHHLSIERAQKVENLIPSFQIPP